MADRLAWQLADAVSFAFVLPVYRQGAHLAPAADQNVVGVDESCTMLQRQMECVWAGKEGAEVARLGMVEAHRLPAVVHALRQLWLFVGGGWCGPTARGGPGRGRRPAIVPASGMEANSAAARSTASRESK